MAGERKSSATGKQADKAQKKRKTRQSTTDDDSDRENRESSPSRKTQKTVKNTGTTNVREPQDMANAACRATFDTAELFGEITSYLTAQTILTRLSRVSKSWNNTINASPTIQKQLWRGPRATGVSAPVGLSGSHSINQIYHNPPYKYKALASGVPMYSGTYQINSLFPNSLRQRSRHSIPEIPTLPGNVTPIRKNRPAPPQQSQYALHALADMVQILMTRDQPSEAPSETPTWLGIHLAEPPISTAWIEVFAEIDMTLARGGGTLRSCRTRPPILELVRATVRDSTGVTFGLVRDAADKIMAQPAYEHVAREKKPVTIRICFVVDSANVELYEPPKD